MTAPTASRPLALVTGASSGIGLELARELAVRGHDLVVTAEDAELDTAAATLSAAGTQVTPVRADLSTPAGVEQLWAAAKAVGRPLDVVCLNAGVGKGGPFVENDLEAELQVIALNVTGTVHLAKRVLQDMVARGSGRVLVTSSIASTQPGSYHAVYNASKSFEQSFTQGVQEELKGTGVTLTSLMPGPTDTEFFDRGDLTDTPLGATSMKDDPAQVAKQGIDALMNGERKVVGGSLMTKLQAAAAAVLPDAVKAKAHALMAKPKG
ncbi:MAG: SDR family NAD(P)-dependent oxidoreductase [Actinomycetota bacterium]|nr:SDR family NAD(P)-dependent oxidoreductase [Actinomycetota bacterium]